MKRLVHLTALIAAVAAIAPTAADAARPRVLPSHQLGPVREWLGTTDAATAAFSTASGTLLRPDHAAATTAPAPAGCTPMTAGEGLIAYECGHFSDDGLGTLLYHLAVTDAAGHERTRFDERVPHNNAGAPLVPDAIGTQWIHSSLLDYHAYVDVYVNWHTGETRLTNVDDGSVADLDAPGLRASLCRPLKPVIDHDPARIYAGRPYTLPFTARGRWVLQQTAYDPVAFRLRRCGAATAVRLPAGFARQPVLGDGWLAGLDADGLHLLRLSDRKQFRVKTPDATYNNLRFTRDRLYFGSYSGSGAPWRTVQLPKR